MNKRAASAFIYLIPTKQHTQLFPENIATFPIEKKLRVYTNSFEMMKSKLFTWDYRIAYVRLPILCDHVAKIPSTETKISCWTSPFRWMRIWTENKYVLWRRFSPKARNLKTTLDAKFFSFYIFWMCYHRWSNIFQNSFTLRGVRESLLIYLSGDTPLSRRPILLWSSKSLWDQTWRNRACFIAHARHAGS